MKKCRWQLLMTSISLLFLSSVDIRWKYLSHRIMSSCVKIWNKMICQEHCPFIFNDEDERKNLFSLKLQSNLTRSRCWSREKNKFNSFDFCFVRENVSKVRKMKFSSAEQENVFSVWKLFNKYKKKKEKKHSYDLFSSVVHLHATRCLCLAWLGKKITSMLFPNSSIIYNGLYPIHFLLQSTLMLMFEFVTNSLVIVEVDWRFSPLLILNFLDSTMTTNEKKFVDVCRS